MTSLEDTRLGSPFVAEMETGLNIDFSPENSYTHNILRLSHALKCNTYLCSLAWCIVNIPLEKGTPWGTPSQGAAAPEP